MTPKHNKLDELDTLYIHCITEIPANGITRLFHIREVFYNTKSNVEEKYLNNLLEVM